MAGKKAQRNLEEEPSSGSFFDPFTTEDLRRFIVITNSYLPGPELQILAAIADEQEGMEFRFLVVV